MTRKYKLTLAPTWAGQGMGSVFPEHLMVNEESKDDEPKKGKVDETKK